MSFHYPGASALLSIAVGEGNIPRSWVELSVDVFNLEFTAGFVWERQLRCLGYLEGVFSIIDAVFSDYCK